MLFNFSFMNCIFGVKCKNSLPRLRSRSFSPMLFSRRLSPMLYFQNFIVLCFTFKFRIYFKLTLIKRCDIQVKVIFGLLFGLWVFNCSCTIYGNPPLNCFCHFCYFITFNAILQLPLQAMQPFDGPAKDQTSLPTDLSVNGFVCKWMICL